MNDKLYENQLFKSRVPFWRVWLFFGLCSIGFVVILMRAAYVQVINSDFYKVKGEQRFTRNIKINAARGNILDRNGLVLAQSVQAWTVTINPRIFAKNEGNLANKDKQQFIEKRNLQIKQLANILNIPVSQLSKKMQDASKSWLVLAYQVALDKKDVINSLKIEGLQLEKVYKREYSLGEASAHLLGATNIDEIGQEGIELIYDKKLQAKAGQRRVLRDSRGNAIGEVKEYNVDAIAGEDVQLTIDKSVQSFAFKTLKEAVLKNNALSGSAVVMDAKSGEVLALVNYPSYDPNNRKTFLSANMRNKVLTDMFEPGSTMKPFSIATALEVGLVKPNTLVDTGNGHLTIYGRSISDVGRNGILTVSGIIQKSSNIGVAKIATKLPSEIMWKNFSALGFGIKPDIDFPSVASGSLRHYSSWRPIEKITMAYGYGLSVSLFQLAAAYTVFANNGAIVSTSILKKADKEPTKKIIFSAKTANQVKNMLQLVTMPGGGGLRARTPDYSVGGKSGTAQKQVGNTYSKTSHRAWFAGISPITDPKIVVAVMIDDPKADGYYGGRVAAPVFSEIVEQTLRQLRVKPDVMHSTNKSNFINRG